MIELGNRLQDLLDSTRKLDFLGPLALRMYLVPVFWVAGMNKASGFDNVVAWFANSEWGLGLPAPALMAFLATGTEIVGALLLFLGLATRWICLPLMVTMIVAATTVHWDNGWQAVHDPKSPFASQYAGGLEAEDAAQAGQRLERAKSILKEHGDYEWLTESGSFVVSNSGIEFAATYFIMLIALFFIGGGRFFSMDYWIEERFRS
jgi:uncharacterized membrane protein YphA (DoxX/SURF4 family)